MGSYGGGEGTLTTMTMITPAYRIEYFPGTDRIVPALLTDVEAARLLRLDIDATGNPRPLPDQIASLDHLVRKGLLVPVKIGRPRRFSRDRCLGLVDELSGEHRCLRPMVNGPETAENGDISRVG